MGTHVAQRQSNILVSRWWQRFARGLGEQVDGASLAFFRISFGLVMIWLVAKYALPLGGPNRLTQLYVDVPWNFTYFGFEWVRAWPEPWLTVHFVSIAAAGLLLALGLFTRLAAAWIFVAYTYVFLLEQSTYNNHYYLICLFAFLLIWVPANRRFSLDNVLFRRREVNEPDFPFGCVPFWAVFLIRFQLFVVYFYGGIAKLNADWLSGLPLLSAGEKAHGLLSQIIWLSDVIQPIHLCLFMAWTGLIYDLSIGFLLLIPRTRFLGITLTLIFHGCNHFIFPIGVFPVMAFSSTLIFLEPDWPLRCAQWFRRPGFKKPDLKWMLGGMLAVPIVGASLGWKSKRSKPVGAMPRGARMNLALWCVCGWMLFQSGVPLIHHFVPGDANWTEEWQQFSWRMMLRAKAASYVFFHVEDAELQTVDGAGRSRVNWDCWPQDRRREIYVPIDCQKFVWDHHPGLTMTFEPGLGRRLIFKPKSLDREAMCRARRDIETEWQRDFGRKPEIQETIDLPTALAGILKELPGASPPHLRAELSHARRLAERTAEAGQAAERQQIALVDVVTRLRSSAVARIAEPWLRRVHPFALQGAHFSGHRFFMVYDPQLEREDPTEVLLRLSDGEPSLVWLDLSRLRPHAWRDLPAYFVTFEEKRLKIVWNYFRELNHAQIDRFTARPQMIHQYAQRIARLWEAETGRKPEVYATSLVMMNYRYPRPLVDPQVDLVRAPYHVFRHNAWILPLDSGVIPEFRQAHAPARSKLR